LEKTALRLVSIATFGAVLGCTSGWAQALPKYVPAGTYRALSCDQLAQEGRAISRRGFLAAGLPAGQGGTLASPTGSAIVLLWPEMSRGRDEHQSEMLAVAGGQMNAIEQASVEGQCSIQFQRPSAR
jgi:hypothetical protein